MRNKLYMYFVATITFVAIVGGNYLANKVNVQAEIADPEVKGVQYDSGDNNFVASNELYDAIEYQKQLVEQQAIAEAEKLEEEKKRIEAEKAEIETRDLEESKIATAEVKSVTVETLEVVPSEKVSEPQVVINEPKPEVNKAKEEASEVEPAVCDESTQWYSEDYTYCIDKPVVAETEVAAVTTTAAEPVVSTVPPATVAAEPVYYNSIAMPSVGIGNVPVVYASMNDFFEGGDFSKPLDTDSPGSAVQNLMRQGVTHVPFSGSPGAVGNSYLVGHSSSPYGSGSSYIDSVFENLMYRGAVGDEFYFHDSSGKKLTYRIFEAREISAYDVSTAYAPMGGRKVMTIQTCTYTNDLMWIVRGELVE